MYRGGKGNARNYVPVDFLIETEVILEKSVDSGSASVMKVTVLLSCSGHIVTYPERGR